MKINIDVDATPEELRVFFGLPDVQPLQKEMMEVIAQKMREGVEGYDALSLLQPMMSEGVKGWDAMQRLFWQGFTQGFDSDSTSRGGKSGGTSSKKGSKS